MPVVTGSGETRVNTVNAGDQYDPCITTLKDGGWIVTWTSGAGENQDVHQQRFDARGQAVGQEIRVNTTSQNIQFDGSVTALQDGGWMVVWGSRGQEDGTGRGVYQQRYDVNGRKIGPERLVNSPIDINQLAPEVTALEDGGWVITWHGNHPDGQNWDTYQQRYDARGYERGDQIRVNTVLAGSQAYTDVTALKDGGWLVTWNATGQDGDLGGVYQQRYDASGAKFGTETRVNTHWQGDQFWGTTAGLADGGWIVTWTSEGQDGSGRGVYQQQYNADGWSVDGEIRIDTNTSGNQEDSSIVGLADGGWVVTWSYNDGQDPSTAAIYQKRYAANGQALTGEIKVNAIGGIAHGHPFIAVLPDGGWVVTWRAAHGGEIGIYQQRFTATGTKIGPTTPTDLALSAQPVKEGASDTTVVGILDTEALVTEGLTYTLLNDANGRFRIEGNQIKVQDGAKLDYEQARSHRITVEVKDAAGAAFTKTFTIAVSDVASENLAGGSFSDSLTGGRANDILSGKGGHDMLKGGAGNDVLTGGAGQDVFVFDTRLDARSNRDTITDYTAADDSIWVDNAVFTKLGKGTCANPMKLNKAFFKLGDKPTDTNDYVIYSKTTGKLSYDADGSGTTYKAVEIAVLKKGLALTYNDFFVI